MKITILVNNANKPSIASKGEMLEPKFAMSSSKMNEPK